MSVWKVVQAWSRAPQSPYFGPTLLHWRYSQPGRRSYQAYNNVIQNQEYETTSSCRYHSLYLMEGTWSGE
jgi:hypothetical protein